MLISLILFVYNEDMPTYAMVKRLSSTSLEVERHSEYLSDTVCEGNCPVGENIVLQKH